MYSLKRSLLLWLIIPLLLILPAVSAIQYWLIVTPAKAEIDAQLGDFALALARFIHADNGAVTFKISAQAEKLLLADQSDKEYFLVLDPAGRALAGDEQLRNPPLVVAPDEWQFIDGHLHQRRLRILVFGTPCGAGVCQIRIAETFVKRNQVHIDALIATIGYSLLFGFITLVVIVLAVRRSLAVLTNLNAHILAQNPNDLILWQGDQLPKELEPLIASWNQLISKLKAAHRAQQQLIADVAHQMRTPLSSLKMEAELALLEPHPPAVHAALENLNRAASRAAHLAAQLLTLARADQGLQAVGQWQVIDLKTVVSALVEEWSRRAMAQAIDLGFELESALIFANASLLTEAISNLLDNAFEYAGPGSVVTVRCRRAGEWVFLDVEDNGPGIPPEHRERVWQRFYRADNAPGQGINQGSGLGLAIVAEIAKRHDAVTEILSPMVGRGTRIRLSFHAAPVALSEADSG
ncbi:MAG: sensor histidine kinase [Halothiobacillus sp.]